MSSLLDIIKGSPIVIGTATKLTNDASYGSIMSGNFNALTHEWSLKWGPTEGQKGVISLNDDARSVIETAKRENKKLKGHALVWHLLSDLPAWYASLSVTDKKAAIQWHIKNLVGRLKGSVYKWDVVNEAIDDATNMLRPFWQELGGIEMISNCFRWANEVDPSAILIYNDYCCTNMTAKADAIFKMIHQLKQSGCPVHEVGFQTHESVDVLDDAWFASMKANMQRFRGIGVTVNISELDLHYDNIPVDVAISRQAECYYKMVKTALSDLSICSEVTFWQFSSKYSWVYDFFKGTHRRFSPCPWDENNNPTPAVEAIKTALREIMADLQNRPNPSPTPLPSQAASPSPPAPPAPPAKSEQWSSQACQLSPAYIVSNRKYSWSGPIIQVVPGKTARLDVWVESKETLILTLKYIKNDKTFSYTNLLRTTTGHISHSFAIPMTTAAYIYIEGETPNFSFVVGQPTISYEGQKSTPLWKTQECSLDAAQRVHQRSNAWSGPIVGLKPNTRARFTTKAWLQGGATLLLTLKYTQTGKVVYTNLLKTHGGAIDTTFNVPQTDSAQIYLEGTIPGFDFVVSQPKITYL